MKILVVGSGAREHAIVWKLAQSPKASEIYVAPGNAGTAQIARNLDIPATDIEGLAKAAKEKGIELVVVGPEAPLAAGIVDHFQKLGIPIFGPAEAAAQIEASKVFAKDLMQKYGIPCARSASFSDYAQARAYLSKQKTPIVIKADGLAAGKGVIIAATPTEAQEALDSMMVAKAFGEAGKQVVIEECLAGKEMSAFAFSDGDTVVPMVPACDYKRVYDGDRGPNTGGMGSYSPPAFYTPALAQTVQATILEPTIRAMATEGRPYKGILYAGLMLTQEGAKVLEYNARFGDPETQVVLPRLKSDLVDIMLAVINGKLNKIRIEWSDEVCVGVVMASGGYPGGYKNGFPITGWENLDRDVTVFHAGTKLGNKGEILTNGGRVLTVVATGKTLTEARNRVYVNIPRLKFEGAHYRKDIALVSN